MKYTALAILVTVYGLGIAPAFAQHEGGGVVANTFFTQLPGVVPGTPQQSIVTQPIAGDNGRATAYMTPDLRETVAAAPLRR
jgi:hypothetical protein